MIRGLNFISHRDKKNKNLYLTFDDGPSEEYTNKLLDLLIKYKVEATFFVVGEFAKNNPEIIRRMKKNNFDIGLHSLCHKNQIINMYRSSKKDFDESINILNDLWIKVEFYRPPWGCFSVFTLYFMKKYNLKGVLWSVMADDWKGNTTAKIIEEKLLKRVKNGSVICLHDGRGKNNAPIRTIEALEKFIPEMLDQGYVFKKLK